MRTPYNLPSFYKGQLVVLTPNIAPSTRWPGHHEGWRRVTGAEYQRWLDSPDSKGIDDAGESKLGPTYTGIPLISDRPYEVIRGRVSAARGYGNPQSGCMELQCFATGERFYVQREWFKTF